MQGIVLALGLAYVVGAIPSGYLFAKYLFGIDVTLYGSGNIGATNVARVLGSKKYFFLIFLFDFGKAYGTLFLSSYFIHNPYLFLVACFLLIGNGYSIFLHFRGGKGVATSLGILAFLFPMLFLEFLGVWVLLLVIWRRVDIASLISMLMVVPFYAFEYGNGFPEIMFLLFLSTWVIVRHRENIIGFLT